MPIPPQKTVLTVLDGINRSPRAPPEGFGIPSATQDQARRLVCPSGRPCRRRSARCPERQLSAPVTAPKAQVVGGRYFRMPQGPQLYDAANPRSAPAHRPGGQPIGRLGGILAPLCLASS